MRVRLGFNRKGQDWAAIYFPDGKECCYGNPVVCSGHAYCAIEEIGKDEQGRRLFREQRAETPR